MPPCFAQDGSGTPTEVAGGWPTPARPWRQVLIEVLSTWIGNHPQNRGSTARRRRVNSRSCVRISPDGPRSGRQREYQESNPPMRAQGQRGARGSGSYAEVSATGSTRAWVATSRRCIGTGRTRPGLRGGPRPAGWASRRRRKRVRVPGARPTLAWDPSPVNRPSGHGHTSSGARRSQVDGYGAITQSGKSPRNFWDGSPGKVLVSSSSAGPAREGPQTLRCGGGRDLARAVRRRSCPQRASG